jgi:shikimate dehydrogenase
MTRPYAEVIGDPVAHSKSPLIHNFWLAKLGIAAEYRKTHVRAEELPDYFARRREDATWRGCNVTVPHKIAAAARLDKMSCRASRVGAVNTIVPTTVGFTGHNTDVAGILEALPPALMPPGSEVCVIGTGGAARAAFAALRERDVALLLLSARNHDVASKIHAEFRLGGCVRPVEDRHNIQTADVIINATTLGMVGQGEMPAAVLEWLADPAPDAVVFDMVYSPLETPLLAAARRYGLRTVDGLQMLIGQAAAAFEMFFGQPAPRQHDAELRALLTA